MWLLKVDFKDMDQNIAASTSFFKGPRSDALIPFWNHLHHNFEDMVRVECYDFIVL